MEERDDRSARGEDVPVADADESRSGVQDVRRDEDALLDGLRHAHDVDGFARLVGRDADDGFDAESVLPDGTDDVFRARDVREDGFVGEVFAARNLLERGRVDDDVRVADRGEDAVVAADVPDAELEELPEVVVDDFVGRARTLLVFDAHVVLLGFVAREDDDLRGRAVGAGEQPARQHLAEGAGPSRDENAFVLKDHRFTDPFRCSMSSYVR